MTPDASAFSPGPPSPVPPPSAGRTPRAAVPSAFALLGALLLLAPVPTAAQEAGPDVLISVDMEGVAGLVNSSQLSSSGHDYGLARSLLEEETNAAVRGAFDAGAASVTVVDSHGGKTNVRPDRLDPRAELISGGPRPLGMIHGVGPETDAVVFVGWHARASTADAVADHTYTGALKDVSLDGRSLGEAGLAGVVAGHYGVPVVFLSGDRAATEQARAAFGDLEVAAVKDGIGHAAARGVHPERAREMIYRGVRRGVERRDELPPLTLEAPVTVRIEVASTAGVDQLLFVPGVERIGPRTVRYEAPDAVAAYRLTRLSRLLAR